MKKTFKKGLAVLLSATLVFCMLAMPSYAVSENGLIIGSKDNTFETAYEVTGNFTASINVSVAYYKFTPTVSGYYRVSANPEDDGIYFWAYDSEQYDLGYDDGNFFTNDYENGFDACLNLEAGKTYYFELGVYYFEDVVLTDSPLTFDVTLAYLGTITGAALVSPPDKLTYIQGIDDNGVTEPDYNRYEFDFDITGAFADVTFSGGQTLTLCDEDIDNTFERSYDSEERHLGENTVYYKLGDTVMFSFVITLIENPVESIEIVRLPDKTDYTFGIDGEMYYENFDPSFDLTGLQVKINYKNDTSKTVDWVEDSDDPIYWGSDYYYLYYMDVDGYPMGGDDDYSYELGEVTFYIYYLDQTAEFTLNITPPTFAEKLQILFKGLSTWTFDGFVSLLVLPLYLFSTLFSEPISYFESMINLICELAKM